MSSSRLLPLALSIVIGCNAPATPPPARKPGGLAIGSILQLHDAKSDTVSVFTRREERILVPVGSRVKVIEDRYDPKIAPLDRLVRVFVESGPMAGTDGNVGFQELRPIPAP